MGLNGPHLATFIEPQECVEISSMLALEDSFVSPLLLLRTMPSVLETGAGLGDPTGLTVTGP